MCLYIIIEKITHIANIINISYFKECSINGLHYPRGGEILLRFGIFFLKDRKHTCNVDKIILQDNSFSICKKSKTKLSLALLHTMSLGDTWYGKYGFKPCLSDFDDNGNVQIIYDKNLLKTYENKIPNISFANCFAK